MATLGTGYVGDGCGRSRSRTRILRSTRSTQRIPECPSSTDRPPGGRPTNTKSDEQLLERYAAGSLDAREELTGRHMPMARRLASRHRSSSEPTEDLEQVAYLGLLKTIDRYDPGLGSFVGYAVTTIRGELKRHFRDHGWTLHVSRPIQERYLQVSAAADSLAASDGHSPTVRELARETGFEHGGRDRGPGRRPGLLALRPSTPRPASTPRTGPGSWPTPSAAPEPGYARVELGEAIGPAFRRLPERQQHMLRMRFIEDLTQSEIAARCGVSQMHVHACCAGR